MDFTGARRYGRENDDSVAAQFFKWMAEQVISRVQPPQRFHGLTHEEIPAEENLVIRNWRLAGYYLASNLLPTKKKRHPLELEAMISGMRQRMEEYEIEIQEELGKVKLEVFDIEASERVESKAEKFLKLATHETTPTEEARAAAFALAKMIAQSDVAILSWARVRHFARRFEQMRELFAMLQTEDPLLFFYGAKEQRRGPH